MMRALCLALNIPFTTKMLSWPAGRRTSDGIWGPHWYDAVEQSTGFKPYVEKNIDLPSDLEEIAANCEAPYKHLHDNRLTV